MEPISESPTNEWEKEKGAGKLFAALKWLKNALNFNKV